MNDILKNLKISGINSEGDGIARTENGIIFVNHALPDEIVTAKIFERHKDFALAKIISIEKANPERVTPKCEYYIKNGKCGGCQLQHASYDLQLKLKAAIVRDAMTRIGGFDAEIFNSEKFYCVPSPEAWGYRNKAAFPVQAQALKNEKNRRKLITGFYRAGTHRIEPIKTCPVNAANINKIYESLLSGLNDLAADLSGYDENTNTGKLRHIIIRAGINTPERLLSFVINGKLSAKSVKSLIALGNKNRPDTITLNHNSRPGNTILGNYTEALSGKGCIRETLNHDKNKNNYRLTFDTTSFFQVNTLQAEQLFNYASSLVQDEKNILELYSGVGSLTCYLAGNGANVTSVEEWRSAVKFAEKNLIANNLIEHVRPLCGKAEDVIDELISDPKNNYDAIVLDPPRDGCNKSVLTAIRDFNIKKIVYVSCNPATLARDCKILAGYKYKLQSIRAFDMFPQTAHVETVTLLSRRKDEPRVQVTMTCKSD